MRATLTEQVEQLLRVNEHNYNEAVKNKWPVAERLKGRIEVYEAWLKSLVNL